MSPVITVRTRLYLLWEDGEDEPTLNDEESATFHVVVDAGGNVVDSAVAMLSGGGTGFDAGAPSIDGTGLDDDGNLCYSLESHPGAYTGEREERAAILTGFTTEETWAIHRRLGVDRYRPRHDDRTPTGI